MGERSIASLRLMPLVIAALQTMNAVDWSNRSHKSVEQVLRTVQVITAAKRRYLGPTGSDQLDANESFSLFFPEDPAKP